MQEWEDLLELGPECHERFLNTDNVPELRSLAVEFAGVSQLRGRYWVARKAPEHHTLLFTTEGRGKLLTPAGEQAIEANTLTLLPKNKPFHFSLDSDRWATAWFCLDDADQWQHLNREPSDIRYCAVAAPIYYLLCQLYYEPSSSMRKSPIRQLKQYLNQALGKRPSQSRSEMDQTRRLEGMFNELQQQLHVDWTVADMASRIHYSAPHLHRLCQQVYGQSPMQRLISLRIERARQLLTDTNWPLVQIANTVGYQDVFNFSNRFKKVAGISPSGYRQQRVKNQHSEAKQP
ncbi:AraC family transcriptional regulator [Teredinibacter haidensis]|uniref:AraC family transcriptional regulator n=1 Tax=Teredinibacter haidensis TaxID=2731755 RepID=UPI000948F067|nr:AraC family transcriptional regulator [Teredinibacter haidensis]